MTCSRPLVLACGPYYGWDPLRVELLDGIVSALRAARDAGVRILCHGWESVAACSSRDIRFSVPGPASGQHRGAGTRYVTTLRDLIPKLVRRNFMTVPQADEVDTDERLMWSEQLYASPEVRLLLDTLTGESIASLDAAFEAIDAFGATRIVRQAHRLGHAPWTGAGGQRRCAHAAGTVACVRRTPAARGVLRRRRRHGRTLNGEIASDITLKSMAVETVSGLNIHLRARAWTRPARPLNSCQNGDGQRHRAYQPEVRQYAWDAHSSSRRKPGSTLVCALALGAMLTLGHVGDSRAYKIHRDGSIERVTRDHSPVQKLVDRKKITMEEAFFHPNRHHISSNIGIAPESAAARRFCALLARGRGHPFVQRRTLRHVARCRNEEYCRQERDPRRLSRQLVDAACERGGHDNITVVLVMRAEAPAQDQRETPRKSDLEEKA